MISSKALANKRPDNFDQKLAKITSNSFFRWNFFRKKILQYKKYANKLTQVKKLSKKKMYYEDAINGRKNNPKKLWKFLNSVLPNKRTNCLYPSKLITEEKIFDDPVDILEQFNNYFVEIG